MEEKADTSDNEEVIFIKWMQTMEKRDVRLNID